MKALIYTGIGHVEIQNVPKPKSGFIVRVLGCGICGTDLKTYLKGHHLFQPPTILGHEFYGVVDKAPLNCGFSPGDFVVVAPYIECGTCNLCLADSGSLCKNKYYISQGAFCEFVSIPDDYISKGVFRIPEDNDVFALAEPLACVFNGFEHLSIRQKSSILVVGSGPMGALFALLFSIKGIPVTVIEPSILRREKVASWGIDVREPGNIDLRQFDNIIIAVNKKELVSQYVKSVADSGTVLMFSGLSKEETVEIDAHSIHYREVSLTGSFGYASRHFRNALALIMEHKEEFSRIITHKMPLEEGKAAFALLSAGQAFKIILRP
ncbi:MAG: alcohol dehydrogenase catalytic domain-containing protein [Spirochaetota bacterium]|jgi:L-iditol 2-dehydrogenase